MKYTTFQPKPIQFKEQEPKVTIHIHDKEVEYIIEGVELQTIEGTEPQTYTYYVQNFDN